MRLLIDEHGLDWDSAWTITTATISYTNHTLLPEALEAWNLELFEQLLPRQLEIIYEINARFLKLVRLRHPGNPALLEKLSLIEEGPQRRVRMAHLAVVGSHKVNGVAELHSELLRQNLFHDFASLWPERFTNITNGVTPGAGSPSPIRPWPNCWTPAWARAGGGIWIPSRAWSPWPRTPPSWSAGRGCVARPKNAWRPRSARNVVCSSIRPAFSMCR